MVNVKCVSDNATEMRQLTKLLKQRNHCVPHMGHR